MNKPNKYEDIVTQCDSANIRPHFSNIIGFPADKEEDVYQHLDFLNGGLLFE